MSNDKHSRRALAMSTLASAVLPTTAGNDSARSAQAQDDMQALRDSVAQTTDDSAQAQTPADAYYGDMLAGAATLRATVVVAAVGIKSAKAQLRALFPRVGDKASLRDMQAFDAAGVARFGVVNVMTAVSDVANAKYSGGFPVMRITRDMRGHDNFTRVA